ncbi:hypothetical protein RUM43_008458 [Polyplax serrata]|uniref:glycerol kinase n=1 Tax=Polyplax serrata TaxID=468196 RepID=A0AAN8NMZ8_POLSC
MTEYGRFGPLVGAIDEGTSSVRFIIFCPRNSQIIAQHQIPLKVIYPQNGWVEQDPVEIITLINKCIDVWSDTRAQNITKKLLESVPNKDINHWKYICGLPLTASFSAPKLKWMLEEVPEVQKAASENRLCLGTIDSWIIYNLTGGKNNGVHATDCSNASRTFLMNLDTLQWDQNLCKFFGINSYLLPEIRSSSEIYGRFASGHLNGVPISGCLGDQQAALLGHLCLERGQAKSTYGTGCFLLCNVGNKKLNSKNGLLSTVAFKLGATAPAMYALEGSVAVAGSALNWLRDNLGILEDANSVEAIAEAVTETNDVYFVPAFSGMYAPYWEQNARGVIVGITENTKNNHLIRAALEAVCYQTRDIVQAMEKDCGFPLKELLVDGGMTKNNLLMQLQADLTGIPVVRPTNSEMTALGAAIAAGCAKSINVWPLDRGPISQSKIFWPAITIEERESRYSKWKEAVERSFDWDVHS